MLYRDKWSTHNPSDVPCAFKYDVFGYKMQLSEDKTMKFKYFLKSLNGAFHFNGIHFFFKVRSLHPPPFLTICIILETHFNFCNVSFRSVNMPKLYSSILMQLIVALKHS